MPLDKNLGGFWHLLWSSSVLSSAICWFLSLSHWEALFSTCISVGLCCKSCCHPSVSKIHLSNLLVKPSNGISQPYFTWSLAPALGTYHHSCLLGMLYFLGLYFLYALFFVLCFLAFFRILSLRVLIWFSYSPQPLCMRPTFWLVHLSTGDSKILSPIVFLSCISYQLL